MKKTYYVFVNGKGYVEAEKGKEVEVFSEYQTFVYKHPTLNKYVITELTTGLRIGLGTRKSDAIEAAKENMEKLGHKVKGVMEKHVKENGLSPAAIIEEG